MNKSRRNYVFIMVVMVLLCILNFLVIHIGSNAYGEEQSNPKKYFIGYNENISSQYLNQYILTNTGIQKLESYDSHLFFIGFRMSNTIRKPIRRHNTASRI